MSRRGCLYAVTSLLPIVAYCASKKQRNGSEWVVPKPMSWCTEARCWRRQYLGTERRNCAMTDRQSLAVMIVSDGVAVTS